MPTAYQLIRRSLRLCRVIDPAEALPAADAQDGLEALNALLDTWRLERLMVNRVDRQVFALTAGQQLYSIGPGGNFDTSPLYGATVPRPFRIDHAAWGDQTATPDLEVPIHILTEAEYRDIALKALMSSWSTALGYDPSQPLGTVYLYPGPTVNRHIALYLWTPLRSWPTVQTDLTLAEGMEEALTFNLARRLSAEYGVSLSPEVVQTALEAKALVMRMNTEIPEMELDWRVPGQSSVGAFNELTGSIE